MFSVTRVWEGRGSEEYPGSVGEGDEVVKTESEHHLRTSRVQTKEPSPVLVYFGLPKRLNGLEIDYPFLQGFSVLRRDFETFGDF